MRARCEAIAGVLRSASERLEWLGSLQDVAGLKQMAGAVSDLAVLEWASRAWRTGALHENA